MFKRTMTSPPPLTMETAKATFGDYLIRPRFHVLRGLAEVFCSLDPAYKSHSKVRIGVKGLPKRVIINWGEYGHGYGFNQFQDMVNALATLQGKPGFRPYCRAASSNDANRRRDAAGNVDPRR